MVLEHRGANPAFARRVLRLRKASRGEAVAPRSVAGVSHDADDVQARVGVTDAQLWAGHPGLDGLETMTAEERTRAFVRSVLRPVLSDALTDPGEVVRVDAEFLAAVARAIAPSRPPARVAVADVDLDARRATLLQNRNLLDDDDDDEPQRAIEIKPKCGYVHHLNPHGVSRFRMHQALRVARGEASRASGYDPLDLFAVAGADARRRRRERARRALVAPSARSRPTRGIISARGSPRADARAARRGYSRWTRGRRGEGFRSATGTSDAASVDVAGDRPRRAGSFARPRARARRAAIGRRRRGARGGSREGMGVDGGWRARGGDGRGASVRRRRGRRRTARVMLAFRRITRRGRRRDGNDGVFEVEVPTRGNGDGDGDDGDGDADAGGRGRVGAVRACRVAVVDLDMKSIQKLPRWLALDREISAHWVASSAGCDAEGNAGTRREETVVGGG